MMRNFLWRLLTLVYVAALTYVSLHTGGGPSSPTQEVAHNMCHVPAYMILTYLLSQCFKRFDRRTLFFVFLFAVGYGGLLEFLQSFVPERYPSFLDISLNTLGAAWAVYGIQKFTFKSAPI